MNLYVRKPLYAALALCCLATVASADIKIKSRSSIGGQPATGSEHTVYIKGKRQRTEMGHEMASIMQCDLRRTLQLNGTTKTYVVTPFDGGDGGNTARPVNAGAAPAEPVRRGGLVTTTMTMTDTGERKQMFGYTARRIKTSMITESSPDACNKQKSRMESDGWYIDLAVGLDCYERAAAAGYSFSRPGGCQDQYRTKQVGTARMGYPVLLNTVTYDEAGKISVTMTQEVLEISKAVLDAALFDAPADYRQVKDASEMYAAAATAAAARAQSGDDDAAAGAAGTGGSSASSMPVSARPAAAAAAGPKKPGVVRVGVVMPKATAAEGIDTNTLAGAVQNTLVNYLSGPAIEVVQLQARLPVQAESEAKQKECDYVLYTTVAHKKGGGGGFGSFMRKAAPVAGSVVPYGGTAGSAVAHTVATAAIYTAADFSANVKSKDELTLDYRLQGAAGGAPVVARQLKAKAKADGEDLITQLVEQAATAVLSEATKK